MRSQTLPRWHVLRNMLYIAASVAKDFSEVVEFQITIEPTSLSFPCHDDHPSVSFWGGEQS